MQILDRKKYKILDSVRGRIRYFIDNQSINRNNFLEKTGLKIGLFDPKDIHRAVGSDKLSKILDSYTGINPAWLLTGKGDMLLKTGAGTPIYRETDPSEKKGIPLIPIDAMADWGTEGSSIMNYETSRYVVPDFEELKVDFMIKVKGGSMYPKYNSGDLAGCKKLPLDTFFQWNKVYVLDTIQGAIIKRIKKSGQEHHIRCVSENKDYDAFDLHLKEVRALALVVGVIRLD